MVGSELTQTEARVSRTAEAGTVTMVLVGTQAYVCKSVGRRCSGEGLGGGNVCGAGRACTGAETKEREREERG